MLSEPVTVNAQCTPDTRLKIDRLIDSIWGTKKGGVREVPLGIRTVARTNSQNVSSRFEILAMTPSRTRKEFKTCDDFLFLYLIPLSMANENKDILFEPLISIKTFIH